MNRRAGKILTILFFTATLLLPIQAQKVALKTNALMLGTLTPNLSCEFVTSERTSLDTSIFGHYNPYGLSSKLIAVQPEFRYWFNGRPMIREYLGVALLATTYDMTWKDYIYNGDAFGIGGTFGYTLSLKEKWNIEFYSGFGVVWFRQKQHHVDDNFDGIFTNETRKPNAHGYKLLPAKIGISFSYIIR